MKIVAWIGNQANQKALVNKIHELFPVAGIVTETINTKRKITLKLLFNGIVEKLFLREPAKLWWGMLKHFEEKYTSLPPVTTINVENINNDEAFKFTELLAPDLIIVSGTRLIKKKMGSLSPSIGILNLHTGLSPYIKGGPNCTSWCIATNQFHLIGNTIMWLDEGIDSGNIMTTEFTSFNAMESLQEVHIKVMEHAHDLYCRSIKHLAAGKKNNVKQDSISAGVTYYNRQWNLKQKYLLLKNFKNFRSVLKSNEYKKLKTEIITIPL